MQLVAYGAQDIYLTGNPQITFFKVVYRRHTNFSMEDIKQDGAGTAGFGKEVNYTISRNGDLVHKMYYEIEPKLFSAKPITFEATYIDVLTGSGTVEQKNFETNRTVNVESIGDPIPVTPWTNDPDSHVSTYDAGEGVIQLYRIVTSGAGPGFTETGFTFSNDATTPVPGHTTFIVTFKKTLADMGNLYSLSGMDGFPLTTPPAFHTGDPFGQDLSGSPGVIAQTEGAVATSMLYDSFITIGDFDGTKIPAAGGDLSTVGIDFQAWTADHPIVTEHGEADQANPGGSVFYMNPDNGPALTVSGNNAEIVLGQFTLQDNSDRPGGEARFSGLLQGRTHSGTHSWRASFDIQFPVVNREASRVEAFNHNYCHNLGNSLLKEVEVEIGGQKIDKHYSHWLTTWNELTIPNDYGQKAKITEGGEPQNYGGGSKQTNPSKHDILSFNHKGNLLKEENLLTPKKAYIPLQFWFNRNPGLALPLISLQYHEVKIKTIFEDYANLVRIEDTNDNDAASLGLVVEPLNSSINSNISFYVQYIYLDTDERRRFAQVSHEYLIEQLQYETFPSRTGSHVYDLNFNHPVKEIIWTGHPDNRYHHGHVLLGPGTPAAMIIDNNWQLKLNGHDRFEERRLNYFTRQQIHEHHSGYGGTTFRDSIAVYSFALKPEEHQPSGTCNFSRIDTAQLCKYDALTEYYSSGFTEGVNVYAVNYNVLRIMSGMGGLAYSN